MSHGIVLRDAGMGDVDELDHLEGLVFGDEVHRISRRQWRYLVSRAGSRTVIAESAGKVVGALVLSCRSGGRVVRIYSIAVHPDARRRGIARRFLDFAADFARRGGFKVVHLEVAHRNHAAIALYRAAGFAPIETLRDYYAPGEDGLRMELVLADAARRDAV